MKVFKIIVTLLAISVITACSSSSTPSNKGNTVESKSFDYKAPPVKVNQLEIPPDLTSYTGDDRYGIPGEGESGTRYSDFLQGGNNRKSANVLPILRNVHLERKGSDRWLVVNDKAENIWTVIKTFWIDNGLILKNENSQAGVIETEWSENRAVIPKGTFYKNYGDKVDDLVSLGERDQYRTRLERSKDGNSTEVYITHYGMQLVPDKAQAEFHWIPRPTDHELEATMLQLLMSQLGGGSGVLDATKKSTKLSGSETAPAPKLNKQSDGNQTILLSEPFDKSWRKVGLALEKSGMLLADKDRSKGVYFLSQGKDEGKKKPDIEKMSRIQVNVKEISSGCEVKITNGDGSSNSDTQKILDNLFKALGRL